VAVGAVSVVAITFYPHRNISMAVSKIKVRDGAQLAYEVRGRVKEANPLVLIHSLAMDHTFWNAVTPSLSETTAVLTYDCRGHGQSDKPDGLYLVEQFADDLIDLLDHLGWRSAIIAGASMGGCITLAFAAAHPERAVALDLFDTTAWYNAPDKWEERAAAAEAIHSGSVARTCWTRPLRYFSPTRRGAMPRPAGCSGPAISPPRCRA